MTTHQMERGEQTPTPSPKNRRSPSSYSSNSRLESVPSGVLVATSLVLFCLLWQLAVSAHWVSEYVVPSPSDTADATVHLFRDVFTDSYTLNNLWVTVKEILAGLALAAGFGALFGVLISETTLGRKVLQPLMVALYAAPKVALAPAFVAWFGFGLTPKIVMAATIAFFPVMVDTAAGLAGVDEDQDKLFLINRATRWQRFVKLKLPTALPFLFAGLKSASVLAVIGAIVAEFMGGSSGLGVMVQTASVSFALDRVFALIVLLSVLAFLVYAAVALAERRIVHWRASGFVPVDS